MHPSDAYSINTPFCFRQGYVFADQQRAPIPGTLTYIYTGFVWPPGEPSERRTYGVVTEDETLPVCPDPLRQKEEPCGCVLIEDILVDCPDKTTVRHKLTFRCEENGKVVYIVEFTDCMPKQGAGGRGVQRK